MRAGAALLTFAILAELAGWSDLAILLGDGVLRSGFLGLFVFVMLKVFHGLASFALLLKPLRLLRAISNHQQLVDHRLERALNVLAAGLWAALVCGQLGLLAPATDVISRILSASVNVGTLSVSVADVLVFALTVWLSFLLARLVQVILQEDVFTRVRTARGVPYAISNLARYSVIFLGLLVGLSAAGVEITKLAIVAGGLGVGIGFGLQNIVNNFVSGLILLFERPIDVGDTIEFSDTSGTMQRIGIRASLIRTFDGAEVIVPNGMLLSESVTNWTLSDRRRRVDLDVGVEYGTPAQRVIDLLVDVAKANPKVIHDPAPLAFFEALATAHSISSCGRGLMLTPRRTPTRSAVRLRSPSSRLSMTRALVSHSRNAICVWSACPPTRHQTSVRQSRSQILKKSRSTARCGISLSIYGYTNARVLSRNRRSAPIFNHGR